MLITSLVNTVAGFMNLNNSTVWNSDAIYTWYNVFDFDHYIFKWNVYGCAYGCEVKILALTLKFGYLIVFILILVN